MRSVPMSYDQGTFSVGAGISQANLTSFSKSQVHTYIHTPIEECGTL